jgi:hypothetical protein
MMTSYTYNDMSVRYMKVKQCICIWYIWIYTCVIWHMEHDTWQWDMRHDTEHGPCMLRMPLHETQKRSRSQPTYVYANKVTHCTHSFILLTRWVGRPTHTHTLTHTHTHTRARVLTHIRIYIHTHVCVYMCKI